MSWDLRDMCFNFQLTKTTRCSLPLIELYSNQMWHVIKEAFKCKLDNLNHSEYKSNIHQICISRYVPIVPCMPWTHQMTMLLVCQGMGEGLRPALPALLPCHLRTPSQTNYFILDKSQFWFFEKGDL